MLSRQFTPMLRGVWWRGDGAPTLIDWITAALLVIGHGVVVSHVTALALHGVELVAAPPVHLTHRGDGRCRQTAVILHRTRGPIEVETVRGFVGTSATRAFVDSATLLSLRDFVRVGDALVQAGTVTRLGLLEFCRTSVLDGALRARRAAQLVREGVESFRETDVRLLLGFAGLPAPGCNVQVFDRQGVFLGRSDLVFSDLMVVVEYDGWYHERSAEQRRKDVRRRERFEAAGWTVIVIVSTDWNDPLGVVRRVHRALVRRGWRGAEPDFRVTWQRWADATRDDSAT